MLLSRLLSWFKNHSTTQVFLLEILAVFIGITGSLLVDQWRQQQADYDMLDNELRVMRFNLERTVSNDVVVMNVLSESLASATLLAFGDLSDLGDDELLEHFWRACFLDIWFGKDFVLQANNSSLSIPFNETLSLIEATVDDLEFFTNLARLQLAEVRDHVETLITTADLVRDAGTSVAALKDAELTAQIIAQFGTTGALTDDYVAIAHNREAVREALASPQVKAQLRQLVPMLQSVGVSTVSAIQFKRDVLELIERYGPGMSIPVTEIGVDGSGTLFGWQTYIAMRRDATDPNVWRTTLDLVDGEIKFRADRAWAFNWGTRSTGIDDSGNDWSYSGDIAAVFPRGTAVLNGSNIPVRAGRYEITFNTETLEYSFIETGDKAGE